MTRILIVDDDPRLRAALRRALRQADFVIVEASDGSCAIDAMSTAKVDLIVLDQMMPGVDGVGVCRHLREIGDQTPILMLTARETIVDRVRGLDAGADDYLVKPFALEELLARVRALLRRQVNARSDVLSVGDLVIDIARHAVTRADRPIELTPTEFKLLELLARNDGIVVTRDQIMERVWGYDSIRGASSLDVYVSYVRKKTEEGGRPRLLHTVRGVGFVLRAT